jgi:hypothetical protein
MPIVAPPKRRQINHRTIKLIVGVIAIGIGPITWLLARLQSIQLPSISASYYVTGPTQTVFIGFLFAIAALLAAYNGYSQTEMVLSKVAALAALGVALFPCTCETHSKSIGLVHQAFASGLFLILAYFCRGFVQRAKGKPGAPPAARAVIYMICGWAIVLSIAVLAINGVLREHPIEKVIPRITFYGEATALVAFGISWLTASHFVPGITSPAERMTRRVGADDLRR